MTTLEKAKLWLTDSFDQETQNTIQNWIDTNSDELEDSFYTDSECAELWGLEPIV